MSTGNNMSKKIVKEAASFIKDIFRQKQVFIGGSYALYLTEIFPTKLEQPGDVDIFILSDRVMSTYILEIILESYFDSVDNTTKDPNYYKIPGQWKFMRVWKNGIKFDIIIVDNSLEELIKNTSNSLSKCYFEVSVGVLTRFIMVKNTGFTDAILAGVNIIEKDLCTPQHFRKIVQRTKQLELRAEIK